MATPLPVLITANPFSGKGKNRERVAALSEALQTQGIGCDTVWDLAERRQVLADPSLHERYGCLVSAGGDGSIAAAVNDLRIGGDPARLPIAMLPVGNENLFAIEFGHNRGERSLADAIARGATRTIDAGDAGGRLFTLMASAGFDSDVVRRVDDWRHADDPATSANTKLRRVSRASYAPKIAGAVAGYTYPPVTLEADGRSVTGAHAFVFNIGQYGFRLGFVDGADPGDGLLDWVVFEKPGVVALAGYGLAVLRGKHLDRKDVYHGRSAQIRLTTQRPVPIQADGDPAGTTPMDITALPGMLRVIDGSVG